MRAKIAQKVYVLLGHKIKDRLTRDDTHMLCKCLQIKNMREKITTVYNQDGYKQNPLSLFSYNTMDNNAAIF